MLALFAVHSSDRFVHVTEVERGLACDCRCAVCGEQVIARQGDVREHHFAHSSNAQPCASSYESDLHRFAKRVIVEAGGLVVPVNAAAALALGLGDDKGPRILLACTSIEEEVVVGDRRPDLLAATTAGISVAIEVAYTSFCDSQKRQDYGDLRLSALEIDLRAFTPTAFDVGRVKHALLEDIACKSWLWPVRLEEAEPSSEPPSVPPTVSTPRRQFLPEEIVKLRGRWISVKELPSGDIAIKAVRYDPDVVSVVRTVARQHLGQYRGTYFSWVIPRFRAEAARAQLRTIAAGV
ncbi:competence protein CoiA family protein [Variovorax robiniae]|uniref:Competence protein CoiA family protein n=1 Tax=Variovorax robiniae TaxID=1836199 RepID=A0ABU8X7U3_9BURK